MILVIICYILSIKGACVAVNVHCHQCHILYKIFYSVVPDKQYFKHMHALYSECSRYDSNKCDWGLKGQARRAYREYVTRALGNMIADF